MFSIREVATGGGALQYRTEHFTGLRCRISPGRLKRKIDQSPSLPPDSGDCPFCPDAVMKVTPTFPDGSRIVRGESVTFPNLFPFGENHIVTVITRDHAATVFSRRQIFDALLAQTEVLRQTDGYPSINWNFLPSAGASLTHPHMQGLSDTLPSRITGIYLDACECYRKNEGRNYWDVVREQERSSDRYLFGEEIVWSAHAVPAGEREVRGILPVATLEEMESYTDLLARGILEVLAFYRELGTAAFNMAICFDRNGAGSDFSAFCSIISRIKPNPSSTSDTAFMERLHLEPVIMTLPEDLGTFYRKREK